MTTSRASGAATRPTGTTHGPRHSGEEVLSGPVRPPRMGVVGVEFRIVLEGDEAAPGRVRAADVAKLLERVESAIAKAMGHAIARPVARKGRWRKAIEESAHYRFERVEAGSLALVGSLPDIALPDGALGLMGETTLGDMGLTLAMNVATEPTEEAFDVAEVWSKLGEELAIGSRYRAFRIERMAPVGPKTVRVDAAKHEQLRTFVAEHKLAAMGQYRVVGQLYEGDFIRKTATLRTSRGDVEVSFDPPLEDKIYETLRHQATIVGEVTYDPRDMRALSVRARAIDRPQQLEAGDFWHDEQVLVAREARPQHGAGPGPVEGISDAEWDALYRELGLDS